MSEFDRRRLLVQIEKAKREIDEYVPNPHRGGLLPDHLREALRRYRANGEGGGVGFEGLSHPLLGSHGSKVWANGDSAGGKRLFK
jgi:transcription initiation factor TFIID subunit 11